MELSTLGVGCLCQGSLQASDPNMAALEDQSAMEDNLPLEDQPAMVDNLPMVDNNLSMVNPILMRRASLGIPASLATAVQATEVKGDTGVVMDLDL